MSNSIITPPINTPPVVAALPDAWATWLAAETSQPYWQQLHLFLQNEIVSGKTIYPPPSQWYNALAAMPPSQVKVVILGQDPYHGTGQAHGLSFSVPPGVKPPPSLVNIYKEIQRDLADSTMHGAGWLSDGSGDLSTWAQQGVLLLNSVLTVTANQPGSHQKRGWERFTDALVQKLAAERQGIVFMLWGAYAASKAKFIDDTRHCVLRSAHPSPLSAYRGFIGNGHFSAANHYLTAQGLAPIVWRPPLIE